MPTWPRRKYLFEIFFILAIGEASSLKLVNIVSVSSAAYGYDIITNIKESMPR